MFCSLTELTYADVGYKKYGLNGYMVKSLWTGNSTLVLADAQA